MSLEFKIKINVNHEPTIISIIEKISLNQYKLDLSSVDIEYVDHLLVFCIVGVTDSRTFRTIHSLVEKITYLYGIKEIDPRTNKKYPVFYVENDELNFILNSEDFERLPKNEQQEQQSHILNKQTVYIGYIKKRTSFNNDEKSKMKYIDSIINGWNM